MELGSSSQASLEASIKTSLEPVNKAFRVEGWLGRHRSRLASKGGRSRLESKGEGWGGSGVAGAAGVPKPLKAGWAGDLSPKPKVGVHVAGAGSPAGLGPKAKAKASKEALLKLALVLGQGLVLALVFLLSAVGTSSCWRFLGLVFLAISEDLELSIVGQAQEL